MNHKLEGFWKEIISEGYSSEINQDAPIASSQLSELLLSFIDRIYQICI
jgi:hypothetical protein